MAYNNSFPIGYQQMYPQYQYQMPQYQQQYQQMQQNTQQNQGMSPPTVHADIVQVSGEQEATNFPVAAGASQMMVSKDDSMIFVKTAYANGQSNLDVFVKRPPRPIEPPIDMKEYVTRDELERRLSALSTASKKSDKEVPEA